MTTLICTERLRIRRWTDADIDRLYEIYADPQVTRFLPGLHAESVQVVAERHPHLMASYERYGPGFGVWAAQRLTDDHVVGTVMLKHLPGLDGVLTDDVEVGWHLGADCWGHGYATEMAAAVVDYGFNALGLARIVALAVLGNDRSFAVMRRLGMARVGANERYYGGVQAEVYALSRP